MKGSKIHVSTGAYINYHGKGDLFIVINEPNDVNDDILSNAIEFLDEKDFDDEGNSLREIITQLEDLFFPYGVQILYNKSYNEGEGSRTYKYIVWR